jgi:hypothetical protein
MAQVSKREPYSVPDHDGPAWEEMRRKQRAYNAAQEAALAEKRAQAAEVADHVNTAAGLAPAVVAGISAEVSDLRAAKAAVKTTGAVGKVIAPLAAVAGYKADRANGVARDEAVIKNGVGPGVGLAFGALATAAFPATAPLWLAEGTGALVGLTGGPIGNRLAQSWRHVRDDPYWRDQVNKLTNPSYFLNRARQGQ